MASPSPPPTSRLGFGLLAVLLVACISGVSATDYQVCISKGTASECKSALDNNLSDGGRHTYSCTKESSDDACLAGVKAGDYHFTIVGGNELFAAHNLYNLAAIVAEGTEDGVDDASYYGVPLVHKDFCSSNTDAKFDKNTLQGKQLCTTGYRKTSGWYLPVGKLFDKGIVPKVDDPNGEVNQDAYSLGEFFGSVCATRTTEEGPKFVDGSTTPQLHDGLCDLCQAKEKSCEDSSEYAGYKGSLQCLVDNENANTIAFMKQSTFDDYLADNSYNDLSSDDKANYHLLCDDGCEELFNPDGSLNSVYKESRCSTGKSASNAIVARRQFVGTTEYNNLMAVLGLGSSSSADLTASALKDEDSVGLFSSDTQEVFKISNPATDAGFKNFFTAYDNFREIRNSDFGGSTKMRICVPMMDDAYQQRCADVMNARYGMPHDIEFECVKAEDEAGCLKKIQNDDADITTVGGYQLFTAYKDYALDALVAELYPTTEDSNNPASYFGIGVVKADQCGEGLPFTGRNKDSLQGKDSCHTGYRKTAGWALPVGTLLSKEIMPEVKDPEGEVRTDAYSATQFFGRVCAPRVLEMGPKIGGAAYDPMYELCAEADGVTDKVAGDQSKNPYYDYTGALKCMTEGSSDSPRVAWVKHTTLDDYNKQFGASLSKDNFRLLCDDGCKEWNQANFESSNCNNGVSASQAIVARKSWKKGGANKAMGTKVVETFTSTTGQDVPEVAAVEIGGKENFFFSLSTVDLRDVSGQDFEDDFFLAYDQFNSLFVELEDGTATGSTDLEIKMEFASQDDYSESNFVTEMKSKVNEKCNAQGISCDDMGVSVRGVSFADTRRRSLLATEATIEYTVSNAPSAVATNVELESGDSFAGGSVTSVPTADSDSGSDSDSDSASSVRMAAGVFALVLGVLAFL